jgi:hypothetical protein
MANVADSVPPEMARAKILEVDSQDRSSCRREVGRRILRVTRALAVALSKYSMVRAGFDEASIDDAVRAFDDTLCEIARLDDAVRALRRALREGRDSVPGSIGPV